MFKFSRETHFNEYDELPRKQHLDIASLKYALIVYISFCQCCINYSILQMVVVFKVYLCLTNSQMRQ